MREIRCTWGSKTMSSRTRVAVASSLASSITQTSAPGKEVRAAETVAAITLSSSRQGTSRCQDRAEGSPAVLRGFRRSPRNHRSTRDTWVRETAAITVTTISARSHHQRSPKSPNTPDTPKATIARAP
jgi:hypothetical protein